MKFSDPSGSLADLYTRLVESYCRGVIRLLAARVGFLGASVLITTLGKHSWSSEKQAQLLCSDCGFPLKRDETPPTGFELPSRPQWDAFSYLSDLGQLIYATTLLDSFLQDTTLFLFLYKPGSIGVGQSVKVSELLEAKSVADLLAQAAKRRSREVSYLSFEDRIEFLQKTYGIDLTLADKDLETLRHYSGIRNVAIHDQGIFQVTLNAEGRIELTQKTCERHPTPVDSKEVDEIVLPSYGRIVKAIAMAVIRQVLNAEVKPELEQALGAM